MVSKIFLFLALLGTWRKWIHFLTSTSFSPSLEKSNTTLKDHGICSQETESEVARIHALTRGSSELGDLELQIDFSRVPYDDC